MKRQTGFISSSSSSTVQHTTERETKFMGYSDVREVLLKTTTNVWDGEQFSTYSALTPSSNNQSMVWKTYKSSAYQRIEYFLEAVEKLNSPYSKNTFTLHPLSNYASYIDKRGIYKGFVDVVVTFPHEIRLAGIELINPWVNKLSNDAEYNYWRKLPTKFSIFKVNTDKLNNNLEKMTYENDVAKNDGKFRPVKYDQVESDDRMTFLGNYNVYWENLASYKCFFKYNENDRMSVIMKNSSTNAGTATWECKQLVIRIFEAGKTDQILVNNEKTSIKHKICEYIAGKEANYGTTVNYDQITADNIFYSNDLFEFFTTTKDISAATDVESIAGLKLGGKNIRNYNTVDQVYFSAGLEYKLGGIQLLLSPDIFSISEMKMYNYANTTNNKVFVGEWNPDADKVIFYANGTVRRSPAFNLAEEKSSMIEWVHNFNVPPKYLDVQVFAKFKIDFGSFYAGDVMTNLVNINKEPLSIRMTGTTVALNISNGVCFTDPENGEFMSFKDGFGIQMDREGNYDALKAATAVDAPVLAAQSIVATKIEGDYPFDIYFVVKRLF